jgi:ADP-ribosylglycohydrolase
VTTGFAEKVKGALRGQAIGDAMGAPVEFMTPEEALGEFGNRDLSRGFLPPRGWDGSSPYQKGNGRITDDTLITEALIRAYGERRGHMDAHDFERYVLPEIAERTVWVPECQREMPLLERLWWPEKHPYLRLGIGRADPRSAGAGNVVNCGAAMYAMPVGAVNAGDPEGAYTEAASLTLAHNESFAVEAAAVLAAAYAEAFGAGATVESVLSVSERLARDGTGDAVRDAVAAADPADGLGTFASKVREAVAPYDQRTGHSVTGHPSEWAVSGDVVRPSRTAAVEEVPVALAALGYGAGDFRRTIGAAVFYGRDSDTVAAMAVGLFGALNGSGALPRALVEASEEANQRDFGERAGRLARVCGIVLEQDLERVRRRQRAAAPED